MLVVSFRPLSEGHNESVGPMMSRLTTHSGPNITQCMILFDPFSAKTITDLYGQDLKSNSLPQQGAIAGAQAGSQRSQKTNHRPRVEGGQRSARRRSLDSSTRCKSYDLCNAEQMC